jgi:hypothetical protein
MPDECAADGSYASLNLPALMFTHRTDDADHVKLEVWSAPGLTKPSFEEAMKQEFTPAKKGQQFGPSCMLPNSFVKLASCTNLALHLGVRSCRCSYNVEYTDKHLDQPLVEGVGENTCRVGEVRTCSVQVLSLGVISFDLTLF